MNRGEYLAMVADEATFQRGPTRERLLSLLSPDEWTILEWEHGEITPASRRAGQGTRRKSWAPRVDASRRPFRPHAPSGRPIHGGGTLCAY